MRKILMLTTVVALLLATLSIPAADDPAASTPSTQPAVAEPVAAVEPAPAADVASTQPAAPPAQPVDPEVTADAVIKQMLMNRSKEAVLPEVVAEAATQPATIAPDAKVKPLPMPPGAMIVNRVGRLIKDDASGWWRVHFESEKDVLYEAPIRVLPNRMLEAMENIQTTSGRSRLLFQVTGEVTQYHGHRHLLIRRMLVKRDMGAL